MYLRLEAGRNAAENVDSNKLRIRLNSSTLSSQVVRYHNGQQYHQNIFQIHYRDFWRLGNTFTKEILCFTMKFSGAINFGTVTLNEISQASAGKIGTNRSQFSACVDFYWKNMKWENYCFCPPLRSLKRIASFKCKTALPERWHLLGGQPLFFKKLKTLVSCHSVGMHVTHDYLR